MNSLAEVIGRIERIMSDFVTDVIKIEKSFEGWGDYWGTDVINNKMADMYPDDETVNSRAYRKRDWHKNKGKRRIKGGYKGDRYV